MDCDNFCIIGNRNEYATKQIQIISLQPYYVSTVRDKTRNSTKTADRLLQHSVEPIVSKFYRTIWLTSYTCGYWCLHARK